MKLQTIITTLSVLIAPMAIVAQEMFGEYPYCTGCKSNYKDVDGEWNYTNNTWCKVNEKKCQATTCEPVDGYPCCENPSRTVAYVDFDGEWGVENNNWCIRNPLPEFTDVKITMESWLDLMPKVYTNEEDAKKEKEAKFIFFLGIDKADFFNTYEIKKIAINDIQISNDKIIIQPDQDLFLFNTVHYDMTLNTVKLIINNKKTKQNYLKEITVVLGKAY